MRVPPRLVSFCRNIFRKDRVEQELTDEVQAYLDLLIEANVKKGLQPAEARRAALLEMGGVEQVKESVRDVRVGHILETVRQDLQYGARMLLKRPGITLVAALALALGIAANTTIFTTVHALILRPFNFSRQDQLIVVWEQNLAVRTMRGAVAPGNFVDWRQRNKTCELLVAIEQYDADLADGDLPERFVGSRVTGGFFDALGVNAAHGRTFLPEDYEPGHDQVVVLKHSFWRQCFDADPEIIGRRLTINEKNFLVVGVMPPDFNYPYPSGQMWTPLLFNLAEQTNRQRHYLQVIGLLKPGVSKDQAQSDLTEISRHVQTEFSETSRGLNAFVVSLTADAVRGTAVAMPSLIGAALMVLLIACGNVANLLQARAFTRHKEIAVRLALGAGRWRIVRQLLTESILLACLGGVLGLLLSVGAVAAAARAIPEGFTRFIPGWHLFGINPSVFVFTFIITMLIGVLFGLATAWRTSKTNFGDAFKERGRGMLTAGGHHRLLSVLMVTEIALSVVLLIGAGLLVRSLDQRLRSDIGIRPENVLAVDVTLPPDHYNEERRRRDFYDKLLSRIESAPGVAEAGAISLVPIGDRRSSRAIFQTGDHPAFEKDKKPFVQYRVATPGYFKSIGTELRTGRLFTVNDDAAAARVGLVNEAMAQMFFLGVDPVGERLRLGDEKNDEVEIIGVVADVMNDDLDEQADATIFVPYAQASQLTMSLIIHANSEPTGLAAFVRSQVGAVDKTVPISNAKALSQMLDERLSPKRLMTWTISIFAAVSLLLALVGIYAMTSYVVAERTHEFGVRLALGAQKRDVLMLVLRHEVKLTLIGLVIGLCSAIAVTRALSLFLFGVTPTDPLTFTGVALVLSGAALVACYVPARKATKVDPMIALRYE